MADLERCPPTRPIRDPGALAGAAVVDLNEGDHLAGRVRAPPSRLRLDKSGAASEARQIDQFDVEVIVTPRTSRAPRTRNDQRRP